ncbi:MAG: glycosyltransferase family 4 protein [Candidatus Eremiobacteraeota bacterium]|nr:glycosyltransferase family 4 protein [Candidatus Eremiobacteraeota bacterium]
MTLHLGIDAWNLLHDKRGIGRYTRSILERWSQWDAHILHPYLIVPERIAWLRAGSYRRAAQMGHARVAYRGATSQLPLQAVWYPWNGMSWSSTFVNVASLHDASVFSLAPADQALAEKKQQPFRLAAQRAQRIITVSHFAKSDLIRYLGIDPSKIDVIYSGVDEVFHKARESATRSESRSYALFVGEPEQRKGVDVLLHAATLLPASLRNSIEIVLAGDSGEYQTPPVPPGIRVRKMGHVSDKELAQLYAGAAMLVYPSRYEGFGLPVLEAMAAGTPVIASDIPSLREAAGDAAEFVPPGDAVALAAAIARLLSDDDLASRLRDRGTRRAAEFTWAEAAKQTLQTIQRAAEEGLA